MEWSAALAERLVSTPAIHWLDEGRLDLSVDEIPISYSVHHKTLLAVVGRSIKRGQDLGYFGPCISDSDLALLVGYCYALWTDVRFNMSIPGRWLNRRIAESHTDLLVIGNAPAMRPLFIKRSLISGQPIDNYIGMSWPARRNSRTTSGLFVRQGAEREMCVILMPKSKVSESQLLEYRKECRPFAVIYDLTCSATIDRDLMIQYHILKDAFPSAPVIFICAAGDMPVMKSLRDESGIALWVTRAQDIHSIEDHLAIDPESLSAGIGSRSHLLANGISINVEVINDEYFNRALGELLSIASRLESERTSDDQSSISSVRAILREFSSLSVPLATQEELHRLERRRGPYVAQVLRNRIDDLRSKSGSVGVVTELLASLGTKASDLAQILVKPNALSGKACALLDWARENIDANDNSVIVCPNESTRRAMLAFLSSQRFDTVKKPIDVLTRSTLWKRIRYGHVPNDANVLWIGAPNFYTGKFFAGVLLRLTFLVYPSEKEAVEKQIGFFAQSGQMLSDLQGDKLSFLKDLKTSLHDRRVETDSDAPWTITWRERDISGVYPAELPPIPDFVLPDSDWVTDWLGEPDPVPKPSSQPVNEEGVVVSLSDEEADVILPLDGTVLVLDEMSNTSEGMVPVAALRPGMTILVPRDAPSSPLIDRLIDNLRSEPKYLLNERLAERWYLAVETIASRTHRDYERALHLLKKFGVDVVTPQAVYAWFHHKVIGPRTIKSLRAVAEAADMPDIVANVNAIWGAIKVVRETRRLLGRQIAAYIRSGMGIQSEALINRELGLYGNDLEDLTRIGEILRISKL